MNELAQLTELCGKLGAPPEQADVMVRQLMKRAEQFMVQRGQTREEAMAYLLRLVVEGRGGDVPKEFPSPSSPQEN